jgi:hypothetical protein
MQLVYTVTGADEQRVGVDRLRELAERPRPMLAAAATAGARAVRTHFRTLAAQGNKRGWPSQGFYLEEGFKKTSVGEISDTEAKISIASAPMALRYSGGVITAKRGKALTIPQTALAYSLGSPREGGWDGRSDAFLLFRPRGKDFLATRDGRRLVVQYLLRPSVKIPANPAVLPPPEELDKTMFDAGAAALDRALRRQAPGGGS